jgi:replicative DNA helicase
MITIFKDLLTTDKPYRVTIGKALQRIKEGASKDLIGKIRSEESKEARNDLKKKLPCVLFSGEFKQRNANGLLNHSGLICLDFDDVDNRDELAADKYIYSFWLSPSGNGVKALVKIPVKNHYGSFLALEQRYPKIDKACKDVSRVCYESYDPDLFLNEDSEVFQDVIEVTYEKMTVDRPETDEGKIYEAIKKWLSNKGQDFYEGNRNNFLFQLASACSRFGISRSSCDDFVRYDYVHGGSHFTTNEWESILGSAYERYKHQYGTAAFESSEVVDIETKKTISAQILDASLPARDLISLDDVYGDMVKDFKEGIQMGESTYYREIDRHWRWQRGEITAMFGYGNHGKTAMMNQLIHIKCKKENKRFVFFSPEQYPPNDFYHDFVQMHVGKTVMKGFEQMTMLQYKEAMKWVSEHIFYIYPKKEEPTPDLILQRFKEMIIKHKIDGVVVDPFNQLFHDYSERDDKYLSKILTMFKRFALENNIYFIIIAHPSGGAIEIGVDGNYKMPYYTRIAGGVMWGNKMDNILCYNRPYYRTDPKDPTCHFASQKVKKQSRNGVPGTVEMYYDRNNYRFSEFTGYSPYELVTSKADNWWDE